MVARLRFAVLLAAALVTLGAWAEPPRPALPPLSAASLELLASGIALYPDPVLEQIIAAAQHPAAVQRAACSSPNLPTMRRTQPPLPETVAKLKADHPEALRTLAEQPGLTALLGLAARRQPDELRAAVAKVRGDVETRWTLVSAEGEVELGAVVGQVVAGYLQNEAAVAELNLQASALQGDAGSEPSVTQQGTGKSIDQTYAGPQGGSATVQGAGQGSITQTPTKTLLSGEVSGTGTVTGPGGKSASAAGSASGTATQQGDSTTVQGSGQGSATGPNGQTKSASGSMSGMVTTNPDGTKSYQGSGTVTTDKGTANANTTVGEGQASTTVTTGQGSKTYTAGDGQVTNKPTGTKPPGVSGASHQAASTNSTGVSGSNKGTKTNPPTSAATTGAAKPQPPQQKPQPQKSPVNYSQMNQKQMQQASKAHQQSWNMTNQHMKKQPQPKGGGRGRP